MSGNKSKSVILTDPIDILAERMIRRIWRDGHLCGFSNDEVVLILERSITILAPLPALIEVNAPIAVFGDVHGQLSDLIRFLTLVSPPPDNQILFLGDYVDRCKKSFEVIMLLLCYKIRYPKMIHLLRGNHECMKMNRMYGFHEELLRKRTVFIWKKFNEVFNELPLCCLIGKRIMGMHGGISPHIEGWNCLKELKKPNNSKQCDEGIAVDLMWSDPSSDKSCCYQFNSIRSTSVLFGEQNVMDFCNMLDITLVVRAHEVVKSGHAFAFDKHLLTLFSAPNYCGAEGNSGSVMKVNKKFELSFITLKPKMGKKKHLSLELMRMLEKQEKEQANSPNPPVKSSTK